VAVVVVSLFGHSDGVEKTVGDPGVGGSLVLAAHRLRFGVLTWGQQTTEFSGVVRGFFRTKAQRFSTNIGDACGCRFPLWGAVVAILLVLRLQVKTLDLAVSTAGTFCVVALLEASSWSSDTTRFHFFVFVVFVFLCFLFFIFGSPLYLVAFGPLVGAKAFFATATLTY
jgi:hypothetical protein